MSEAEDILTKLKSFGAVEEAREKLPEFRRWRDTQFTVQVKIPLESKPLEPLIVRITFEKDLEIERWNYKSAKKIGQQRIDFDRVLETGTTLI